MNKKGQSPILSAILYTLISLIVVSLVLSVGIPYLLSIKEYNELMQAERTMKNIDSVISAVASEGEGSRRRITITISDPLDINSVEDLIFIEKITKAQIVSPRRKVTEGSFFRGANITVNAYESTIGDTNVLVMENERIFFAVLKLDKNTPITLDQLVYQIKRKDTNEILKGKLDFYFENLEDVVEVATEFLESGYRTGKGHIAANVYGESQSYRINFILESGFDFVRIYVEDLNA